MKILIIALLLSSGSVFGEVLSKETVDAYATSISDIFAPESQEAVEKEIVPALSQINPTHAKDTVRQTKLTVRRYKGPINSSFVAGVIFTHDTINTQTHDVEAALTSAVSTSPDTPIASEDADSTPPIASTGNSSAPTVPTAEATVDAAAPMVPAVDSTAGTPVSAPAGIVTPSTSTAVNPGAMQQLPADQAASSAPMVPAPINQNAAPSAPTTANPGAIQQPTAAAPMMAPIDQYTPAAHA